VDGTSNALGATSSNAIHVIDINKDGKKDIIGSIPEGLYWYDNAQNFGRNVVDSPGQNASGLAVADFDQDSLPDIAASYDNGTNHRIALFTNSTNQNFTEQGIDSQGYEYQAVGAVLLLVGLLASLLALVGIHSRARSESPGLAKATGGIASLAALLVLVILILSVGSRLDLLPSTPPPLAMVGIALFILSFLLAGVIVIQRVSFHSWWVSC
jgi:hypothetical protein